MNRHNGACLVNKKGLQKWYFHFVRTMSAPRADGDMPLLALSTMKLSMPPARPPSPSHVEETLPGTDITFDEGFEMLKRGVVFSATSGGPVTTSLSMPRRKAVLMDVANEVIDNGRMSARGSSNAFYSLNKNAARRVASATSASGTLQADTVVPDMGLRITTQPLTAGVGDMLKFWEELWLTLIAAAAGLHPDVHLAGIVKDERGQDMRHLETGEIRQSVFVAVQMAYIVDRFVSLKKMLDDKRYNVDWGPSHRMDLYNLVGEISKAGFIHTDIKPANIVYDATRPPGSRFLMIDLGGDFTRLVRDNEVGVDCIRLINTLLAIISTFCLGDASNTAVMLTSNLRASLLVLHTRITRQSDDGENLLCSILQKLGKTEFMRIPQNSSFFSESDYNALAKQILERAVWYGKISTRMAMCAAGEDWREIFERNTTLSAYQLLVKTIIQRVKLVGPAVPLS